jgi:uncharacterized protein YaaW (UPF0174 family)
MDPIAQADLISKVRTQLEQMDEGAQKELLNSIGAEKLNDAAVRKVLLTAGGLTALSTSVGLAGFSAYILAAQASAFIPLISGPALVSIVAVRIESDHGHWRICCSDVVVCTIGQQGSSG